MKKNTRQADAGSENGSVLAWLGTRRPESLLVLTLLLAVCISGLAVVHTTHKNRGVFHELQQLRAEHNELEVQLGQLLIEQSTFGLETRIERTAMEELDMVVPDWSETVMVRYEQQ